MNHLGFKTPKSLAYSWRTRGAKPAEVKFGEIRRVNIYNTSDYEHNLNIRLNNSFFLLRALDEVNSSVKKEGDEIRVNFMARGSASLDFGVLE